MDLTAEVERKKYEKVWRHKEYRAKAPGEALVERAYQELGMEPGQTLIDMGCGTGRAAARFERLGLKVVAVDIAENCLDIGIRPWGFLRACLWDMPMVTADWGFCTDVMEHIPEDKVWSVLETIRDRVERGVFFQIALFQDSWFGERLHLTVKPAVWWLEKLAMAFKIEKAEPSDRLVALCRKE